MTARRLSVLIEGLPPDSALHRDGRMWTMADEIAAVAIEDASAWQRLAISIHLDDRNKKKLPDATVLKHPDRRVAEPARKERKVVSGPAEIARLLGGG